jgi:predicted transcriptional regulator
MKYRSRLDIVAEILKAASDGENMTFLMYSAYLSYAQFKDYTSALTKNGMLAYDPKKKVYTTSSKGHEFLANYEKLKI